ncbi:MAG: TIGR02611 family protein [Mycobacteriales bacterium]
MHDRPGTRVAYRAVVGIVGAAVVAGGVLLLPLPGPGWLIIFLGLGILATEFSWAKRLLRWARGEFRRWTQWTKRQPGWVQGGLGVGTAAVVVAALAGYVAWQGVPGWLPGWVPGAG